MMMIWQRRVNNNKSQVSHLQIENRAFRRNMLNEQSLVTMAICWYNSPGFNSLCVQWSVTCKLVDKNEREITFESTCYVEVKKLNIIIMSIKFCCKNPFGCLICILFFIGKKYFLVKKETKTIQLFVYVLLQACDFVINIWNL